MPKASFFFKKKKTVTFRSHIDSMAVFIVIFCSPKYFAHAFYVSVENSINLLNFFLVSTRCDIIFIRLLRDKANVIGSSIAYNIFFFSSSLNMDCTASRKHTQKSRL